MKMLERLPQADRPPLEVIAASRELDRHYGPARYPNMHPEGAPLDYYSREDAERTLRIAGQVLDHARRILDQGRP